MVKKTLRPRGRPRNFDEGEALDRATKVFWAKGFDGATIDDLVASMGVCRPSLYATFGDKETLFMRCIEHYGETVGRLAIRALLAAPDIQRAILGFLRQAVESSTGGDAPPGCLLVCVVPAVDDAKVREFSARAMTQAEEIIAERLQGAVADGELLPDFPCAARSRQIFGMAMALALRARAGASRESLLTDAADGAALVLGDTLQAASSEALPGCLRENSCHTELSR
jgi:AcrR family transcriptional regulator